MSEHLQRDAAARLALLGFINGTHPAFAEQSMDAVAAEIERLRDHAARREARRSGGQQAGRELTGEAEFKQALRAKAAGIRVGESVSAFETGGR
jgi:hypothetical protein